MSEFSLTIKGQKPDELLAFSPGETIRGTVSWNGTEEVAAEVRLFWFTSGRGDRDVGIVDSLPFPQQRRSGSHEFSFSLPAGPYSFSGTLISLSWAVEAILTPSEETLREDFILAPGGEEVVIGKA